MTSDWSLRRDALQLDVGVNAQHLRARSLGVPAPGSRQSAVLQHGAQTGRSGFAKLGYTVGCATLFGDVQARRRRVSLLARRARRHRRAVGRRGRFSTRRSASRTRQPSAVALRLVRRRTHASRRAATCSPASTISTRPTSRSSATSTACRPERVRDLEVGGRYRTARSTCRPTSTRWTFTTRSRRSERLSYIGTPLRKNVGASYRRGLEADVPIARLRGLLAVRESGREHESHSRVHRLDGRRARNPSRRRAVAHASVAVGRARCVRARHRRIDRRRDAISEPVVPAEQRAMPALSCPRRSTSTKRVVARGRLRVDRPGNNLTNNKEYGAATRAAACPTTSSSRRAICFLPRKPRFNSSGSSPGGELASDNHDGTHSARWHD